MTAAGDAVLAVARSRVGMSEQPPGSNAGPWWDWYGSGNLGSWCACFVSWCAHDAGYPLCPVDSANGFVLVSSGTIHSYEGFEVAQEAQRTVDLQPGDVVLFSWESWTFQGGLPIIVGGEWDGWVAGDHTGVCSSVPDGSGYFHCVEGNTSGGVVAERTDRHISQVCGWWRPLNYGEATVPPTPEPVRPKEDTMIVRSATTGQMFAVSAEGKRLISGGEWDAWQRAGLPYVDVGQDVIQAIPDVQRAIIRNPADGAVYAVGESGKRYLSPEEYAWRSRDTAAAVWDDSAVGTIPDALL